MSILDHVDGMSILNGVLGLVSFIYPPAAPIIGIIEKAAPYILAAKPLIAAAIKEGPGAFAAAKEVAPELSKAINELSSHVFAATNSKAFGKTPEAAQENITRAIFGFRQMTFEEEMKWMNSMTPGNDPSQENSKYTIG